ncbi:exodeoxyribonuclease VII large subunit [Alicyclobacillus sacchari]|uniref:Exodeoxyribonuclease 7 large subunit n=1 Tax=Alicyclobacillus sacchari TaxID=392010 RepID=A0A4R8LJ53_9BACL|nr:exodeoxyribonuclease VII large subunit [Alicyclobacillus sacchari]TDY43408.1 exodeoxyribonuclease VII large subunit [Alicyclobacillus sacchari]
MSEAALSPSAATVFTVTELNLRIKRRIEADPSLTQCYVAGEISNFKHHSSGHMYFTLKDETSRIRAVMFAGRNRRLRFKPEDGMRVIALGTVSVFDRDGQYQLYVDDLQPDGVGALYVRFEQLRNQLQAEGLFAAERKRKLPMYPKRIGVVTSATGAVIRDICTTLERRYPLARVVLAPAQVQGVAASRTIVAALERLWRLSEPVDVIIVGRGGGSLEELWPFNEEEVARAVARSPIPIVSAVGHETDVTICDYVADVRAATPTAAAELVAPHYRDLQLQLSQTLARSQAAVAAKVQLYRKTLQQIENRPLFRFPERLLMPQRQAVDFLEGRLRESFRRPTVQARRRLDDLERRLLRTDLRHFLGDYRHCIERLESRLGQVLQARIGRSQADLDRTIAALEALNPLAVLRRGYSLVLDQAGDQVLASVEQFTPGRRIQIQVVDGMVEAEVKRHGDGRERSEQIRLDI